MTFTVSQECRNLGLRAGAILLRGVRVAAAVPELRAQIAKEVEAIRARFGGPQAVRSLPEVTAFHELLRKVGVNPRKEQPSVERLLTFAVKRGELPAVNSLVDAYNLASVRSFCSLGAHDMDHIAPPVALRLFTDGESFTPLGRAAPELVSAGEYGYVDGAGRVLCRLDLLQADFSKVTAATVNALLIVEGTVTHDLARLQQAVAEAIELVTRYCGGTAEIVAQPED
jgi:DNA/RNA-binding domain of Phe-tRNA-synthetase-like protein